MMALTSTQGGLTATYRYSLAEVDGGTEAMKKADRPARSIDGGG
jgi:hypothetical protein